jgi:hypothetical protein
MVTTDGTTPRLETCQCAWCAQAFQMLVNPQSSRMGYCSTRHAWAAKDAWMDAQIAQWGVLEKST